MRTKGLFGAGVDPAQEVIGGLAGVGGVVFSRARGAARGWGEHRAASGSCGKRVVAQVFQPAVVPTFPSATPRNARPAGVG